MATSSEDTQKELVDQIARSVYDALKNSGDLAKLVRGLASRDPNRQDSTREVIKEKVMATLEGHGHAVDKFGHVDKYYGHMDKHHGHIDRHYEHLDKDNGHVDNNCGFENKHNEHIDRCHEHVDEISGHTDNIGGLLERHHGHMDKENGHIDSNYHQMENNHGHLDKYDRQRNKAGQLDYFPGHFQTSKDTTATYKYENVAEPQIPLPVIELSPPKTVKVDQEPYKFKMCPRSSSFNGVSSELSHQSVKKAGHQSKKDSMSTAGQIDDSNWSCPTDSYSRNESKHGNHNNHSKFQKNYSITSGNDYQGRAANKSNFKGSNPNVVFPDTFINPGTNSLKRIKKQMRPSFQDSVNLKKSVSMPRLEDKYEVMNPVKSRVYFKNSATNGSCIDLRSSNDMTPLVGSGKNNLNGKVSNTLPRQNSNTSNNWETKGLNRSNGNKSTDNSLPSQSKMSSNGSNCNNNSLPSFNSNWNNKCGNKKVTSSNRSQSSSLPRRNYFSTCRSNSNNNTDNFQKSQSNDRNTAAKNTGVRQGYNSLPRKVKFADENFNSLPRYGPKSERIDPWFKYYGRAIMVDAASKERDWRGSINSLAQDQDENVN